MYSSKIDVPVLILFFNRPLQLKLVFEQVKLARPSKLYLFQDGAREGRADDIENIIKCREIVEDIDWECEVHRNYQEQNNGCDPSEYLAQKWMFATEEYGIVLEDDDVPSQSFFPYCKELLEKYKDDQRINMICGMNNLGDYSKYCPYDYFFSTTGSIWGWASWKRVIDEWTDHSPFVDDEYAVELFKRLYKDKMDTKAYIDLCKKRNKSGIAYYESIMSTYAKTQGRINIVPTRNMISNKGFIGESTHGPSTLNIIPKKVQKLFNMKTYEIRFPIKHPPYVMEDVRYVNALFKPSKFKRKIGGFFLNLESAYRRIVYKVSRLLKKGEEK